MISFHRLLKLIPQLLVYAILIGFAYIMLFPFLYMFSTSLKYQSDTFRFPPHLIPMQPVTSAVEGIDEPLPLYFVSVNGEEREYALVERNIAAGEFSPMDSPEQVITLPLDAVSPSGGEENQATIEVEGESLPLWDVPLDGGVVPMIQTGQTSLGLFADPQDTGNIVYQNVRLSEPVESPAIRTENYSDVIALQGLDRSLTNTALVTVLVVIGQLVTSVLGGYALARLNFPGRDQLFLVYLGTIMIPFAVLITPLYQLMVMIGWADHMVALIVPWVFTAYGTFLMRQFFITIPKEIEEAAIIDGASRFQILWKIFLPASTPALASLATFSFLYAWNSFLWPLIIINTGNIENHVLTLSLSQLRGRAADNANLVMAGAAIAITAPMLIYIFAQRFFVESITSSGVKG
jgi:ABC-type glycerol-3-phosphate transport system permease component